MKKKLVVALFATVMAFSMTACGSKASAEVVSVSEEAASQDLSTARYRPIYCGFLLRLSSSCD